MPKNGVGGGGSCGGFEEGSPEAPPIGLLD